VRWVGRLATVDGTGEANALDRSSPLTAAAVAERRLVPSRVRFFSKDAAFRLVVTAAGCLMLAIIAAMVVFLLAQAMPALKQYGFFSFLSSTRWAPSEALANRTHPNPYGIVQFIYGTLLTAAVAMLIAVPVSVAVGLFITDIAPRGLRRPLSSLVDADRCALTGWLKAQHKQKQLKTTVVFIGLTRIKSQPGYLFLPS